MWELHWERIIGLDHRIRQIVELYDIQFGFRKGRSTTERIFALRILQEKYSEKGKYLHYGICGFGKVVRQGTKGLDLVVVGKERNTGAVCRHNTQDMASRHVTVGGGGIDNVSVRAPVWPVTK